MAIGQPRSGRGWPRRDGLGRAPLSPPPVPSPPEGCGGCEGGSGAAPVFAILESSAQRCVSSRSRPPAAGEFTLIWSQGGRNSTLNTHAHKPPPSRPISFQPPPVSSRRSGRRRDPLRKTPRSEGDFAPPRYGSPAPAEAVFSLISAELGLTAPPRPAAPSGGNPR